MVFSSALFIFGFLPLLLVLYFMFAWWSRSIGNIILLIFSLIFYGWGGPSYLLLMVLVVMADYVFALAIAGFHKESLRKLFLVLAVIANLGVLGYYKYTNFLVENLNRFAKIHLEVTEIILPIGISFFTFQAMSYVIDVYRRDVKVQKNPLFVMLYVSLFPQLVAGPIVRYKTVEKEITERRISMDEVADGLERFIIGFAKKLIIANNMGALADTIFALGSMDMPVAWMGAIAYTLQIYFDFSAYSDMAIGLGRVFGFHFEENFNFPYIAKSVGDFWRRWHISLTTWFRDYIYIPLGGNRKGVPRMYVNMFIIWTLTGIWHGAEWNFILWGMYYFVFQALEKFCLGKWLEKIPRVLQHIYTLVIVTVGWVIFRCDSGLGQCVTYLKSMFSMEVSTKSLETVRMYSGKYGIYMLLGIVLSMPVYRTVRTWLAGKIKERKAVKAMAGMMGYGMLLALFFISVLYLVNSTYNPFIYFRF